MDDRRQAWDLFGSVWRSVHQPVKKGDAMLLADQIVDWLMANPGSPQSVAEIVTAIPGANRADAEEVCNVLRAQRKLGRNGADIAASGAVRLAK